MNLFYLTCNKKKMAIMPALQQSNFHSLKKDSKREKRQKERKKTERKKKDRKTEKRQKKRKKTESQTRGGVSQY